MRNLESFGFCRGWRVRQNFCQQQPSLSEQHLVAVCKLLSFHFLLSALLNYKLGIIFVTVLDSWCLCAHTTLSLLLLYFLLFSRPRFHAYRGTFGCVKIRFPRTFLLRFVATHFRRLLLWPPERKGMARPLRCCGNVIVVVHKLLPACAVGHMKHVNPCLLVEFCWREIKTP